MIDPTAEPDLPPDAGGELPDVPSDAGADAEDYTDDLRATLREAEGEPAEVDDATTYADDLAAALERHSEATVKAETDAAAAESWNTEFDGHHRQILEAHGLTAEQAAAAGIRSREDTVRYLTRAAIELRQNPVSAHARLASDHRAAPIEMRAQIAAGVLQALGFEHAGAIGQIERQRLQQFEQAERAQAEADQQVWAGAAQTLKAFVAASPPHFEQVRALMGGLMQAGEASTLEQAYSMACRLRGLVADPAAAAKSASEAQRQAIAKARNARTPRTSSMPGAVAADEDGDMSQRDVLRAEFRRAQARGA
jgi:hypothetical protein